MLRAGGKTDQRDQVDQFRTLADPVRRADVVQSAAIVRDQLSHPILHLGIALHRCIRRIVVIHVVFDPLIDCTPEQQRIVPIGVVRQAARVVHAALSQRLWQRGSVEIQLIALRGFHGEHSRLIYGTCQQQIYKASRREQTQGTFVDCERAFKVRREQKKERMRARQLVVRSNNERFDEQMRPSKMASGLMNIGIRNLNYGFGHQPVIAVSRQEDRVIRAWPRPALNRHRNQRSSARGTANKASGA